MSDDTFEFQLPPEEGPEAYYGAGFLDDLTARRDGGASPADLVDLLCLADLGPILEDPARHLPYYVQLLTADAPITREIGEGARIYDRFNERLLEEILLGSSLEANEEAQRVLRIAFAMNAHGVLIECLKGEEPALLLHVSRRLRRSLLDQLMSDPPNPGEARRQTAWTAQADGAPGS